VKKLVKFSRPVVNTKPKLSGSVPCFLTTAAVGKRTCQKVTKEEHPSGSLKIIKDSGRRGTRV